MINSNFTDQDAFVVYSLPKSTDHFLVYQNDKKWSSLEKSGTSKFIIAPFLKSTEETVAIRADQVITNKAFSFKPSFSRLNSSTAKKEYLSDVEQLIENIKKGDFDKIVYSRIEKIEYEASNVFQLFRELKNSQPNAFVFLYHIPDRGCWMGASPELLLKSADNHYYTMALAGTQLDMGVPLNLIEWGAKEIDEQYFLQEFVTSRLQSIAAKFSQSETFTYKAGNVLHICTDYTIDKSNFKIVELAKLLHPGPAISGTPQDKAITVIGQYENHVREDYCGYLGPLDIDGVEALYINLRSMKLSNDSCNLFLGGGITKDSNPHHEWDETEAKSKTLMTILHKSFSKNI